MQCWIELNAKNLINNYRIFSQITGKAHLAPVLKANAYGHGLAEVYEILKGENPPWLLVAYIHEAALLREKGYKGRLLIVTPTAASDFASAAELDLEIFLGDHETLASWLKAKTKPKCHVKFDTGLSRQGFLADEAEAVAKKLKPHKNSVAGICTHFANVEDVLEHDFADLQMQRFALACAALKKEGIEAICHMASSASCLLMPQSRLDLSRVGISLYGLWPSSSTRLSYLQLNSTIVDLKPVLSWKTKVSLVKSVRAGEFVGYGCSYRTMTDTKIAILPLGYFEGYLRLCASEQSYVLIHGKRCPLIGRISMNLMSVNVEHVPNVAAGDVVTLIGTDGKESVDAATIAAWAKTIHYEFITRLSPQIPRKIV